MIGVRRSYPALRMLFITYMKRFLIIFAALLIRVGAISQNGYSPQSALIPIPAKVELKSGRGADLSRGVTITATLPEREFLDSVLTARFGPLAKGGKDAVAVDMRVDSALPAEGYTLDVADNRIAITGGSRAGVFWAIMTLDQILLGDIPATAARRIAPVRIEDAPRYPHRALMLDPARHFLPVEDVKRYIDRMACYKFNTLQLHLTDDEGWRIEIRSHPELTSGGNSGSNPGFYTRRQLSELIDYAAKRHITILPELDIPGHTAALLAAHPEMRCSTSDTMTVEIGKTHGLMLCASDQRVYDLYRDIIAEVAALFPCEYIHLGGDESVIESNWGRCAADSALMAAKGYTAPAQIMNHFFGQVLDQVRANGKKAMLWCELDNIYPPANDYLFDYPGDVVLVTWRNGLTPKCIELTAAHGNRLIMAPGEHAYLDYPQLKGDLPEWNNWGMPVTTLRKTYELDPAYGLPHSQSAHIGGVMATLWGEAIGDINRAMYMTYPRALAIAEAAWSQPQRRSWEGFRSRMWPNIYDMMLSGVSVRVPFEAVAQP